MEMGLLQNLVKNLGKESRKGLTGGLREFMKVCNERVLDVGSLRALEHFKFGSRMFWKGARM